MSNNVPMIIQNVELGFQVHYTTPLFHVYCAEVEVKYKSETYYVLVCYADEDDGDELIVVARHALLDQYLSEGIEEDDIILSVFTEFSLPEVSTGDRKSAMLKSKHEIENSEFFNAITFARLCVEKYWCNEDPNDTVEGNIEAIGEVIADTGYINTDINTHPVEEGVYPEYIPDSWIDIFDKDF